MAADANAVWTADGNAALVSRIDPATGVVQPVRVTEGVTDIALDGAAV
ncbi:MAG: hypothetical protein ACRDM7_09335 [Thermoleophilaceae bacterium]